MQIILHLVIASAIGLIAAAGALLNPYFASGDENQTDHLFLAGVVIILVCWFFFYALVWVLWMTPGKLDLERRVCQPSLLINERILSFGQLLLAVAICTPLLGLRTLYSLLTAAINNQSWNILSGGTFAAGVVLGAVPELLMIVILAVAGCWTLKLSRERRAFRRSQRNAQNVQLEGYRYT